MEPFEDSYFEKLASDLKFSLTKEEVSALKKDFEAVQEQIRLFETVDTDGIEPMVWPFETPTVWLREDTEAETLEQKDALCNAAEVKMGHIHVPKVVK